MNWAGKKNQNSGSAGFTIIETLVAIFVLGMAITAGMTLISVNTRNANTIRNNMIASGLVQEGIEVVRNLRDSDWHASRAFGSFGAAGPVANGDYRVQWDSTQLMSYSNVPLKFDSSNGLYNYSTGADALFYRRVNVATVSATEKRISIFVTWTQNNNPKTLSAESHLFNWK